MSELLRVEHLKKYFNTKHGVLHAVDDVSFAINRGETLGVVGESGCGKSTLGRTVLGLLPATEGKILYDNEDITHMSVHKFRQMRHKMQIVFQDPFSALNPRMNLRQLIADPLKTNRVYADKEAMNRRVRELMDTVGLAKHITYAFPHELDGGRRQRIGIARALALDPEFIVCDEPVSALDVSIQAQILNLLQDLQEAKGLTYIFITHDLSVVKHISTDIMVMYVGTLVEKSPAGQLFDNPLHPYTKGLLSAIPIPEITEKREHSIMQGEITTPIDPKPGCRFAQRCPHCQPRCRTETPELREVEPGHFVACHQV